MVGNVFLEQFNQISSLMSVFKVQPIQPKSLSPQNTESPTNLNRLISMKHGRKLYIFDSRTYTLLPALSGRVFLLITF